MNGKSSILLMTLHPAPSLLKKECVQEILARIVNYHYYSLVKSSPLEAITFLYQ